MSKNNQNIEKLITQVSVESFPSRPELYQLLDNFLHSHGFEKDYSADNKESTIVFSFKNPVK